MKKLVLALLIIASVSSARVMKCSTMLQYIDGMFSNPETNEFIETVSNTRSSWTCGSSFDGYKAVHKSGLQVIDFYVDQQEAAYVSFNNHRGAMYFFTESYSEKVQSLSKAQVIEYKNEALRRIKNY